MKEQRSTERAIDRYLGTFQVRSSHSISVDAPPRATYHAARALDLGKSLPVAALFALRALPHLVTGKARPSRSLTFETFQQIGFTILEERPPWEFVVGAVGKFWRPDSGLLRVSREEFQRFEEPGYAKGALTLFIEERGDRSLLGTETRVACTDEAALRKFSLYWRVIGPFSGLIRRVMLQDIKRAAENA